MAAASLPKIYLQQVFGVKPSTIDNPLNSVIESLQKIILIFTRTIPHPLAEQARNRIMDNANTLTTTVVSKCKEELDSADKKNVECYNCKYNQEDEYDLFYASQQDINRCVKGALGNFEKELTGLLEEFDKEPPVITLSKDAIKEDTELAAIFFQAADKCMNKGAHADALKAYESAFHHVKSSVDYAKVPEVYERMGARDKAALSRLYLALYLLEEEKAQEALAIVKEIPRLTDNINLEPLILLFPLQQAPIPDPQ